MEWRRVIYEKTFTFGCLVRSRWNKYMCKLQRASIQNSEASDGVLILKIHVNVIVQKGNHWMFVLRNIPCLWSGLILLINTSCLLEIWNCDRWAACEQYFSIILEEHDLEKQMKDESLVHLSDVRSAYAYCRMSLKKYTVLQCWVCLHAQNKQISIKNLL